MTGWRFPWAALRRPALAVRRAADDAPARGRMEWSDRYADLALGKRNWQLAALSLLALSALLGVGLVHVASQSRIVPYVVEVDRLGQAVAFGPAEALRKTDERWIRYELALFLRDVRSIFEDAEVQKASINRAYAHASGDALGFLNDYFKSANPFLRASQGTVVVTVRSVLRLSERSWQVEWREVESTPGGRVTAEASWQAVLRVDVAPPETSDLLLVNPLGLYVTEIHWTQNL